MSAPQAPADPARPDAPTAPGAGPAGAAGTAARDIAELPAVAVISEAVVALMSAAALKIGLGEDEETAHHKDLDEARKLIVALAGLVTAAAPEIGTYHAAPYRDGLKSLQLAFREASAFPDAPGEGPGEKLTGPVFRRSV